MVGQVGPKGWNSNVWFYENNLPYMHALLFQQKKLQCVGLQYFSVIEVVCGVFFYVKELTEIKENCLLCIKFAALLIYKPRWSICDGPNLSKVTTCKKAQKLAQICRQFSQLNQPMDVTPPPQDNGTVQTSGESQRTWLPARWWDGMYKSCLLITLRESEYMWRKYPIIGNIWPGLSEGELALSQSQAPAQSYTGSQKQNSVKRETTKLKTSWNLR
jgi:hypothetical protein